MKKILVSVVTIAIVSVVAVGATRAYFSSEASSTGNTFSTGTLTLKLSNTNNGTDWSNPVTATWSSPASWAPGDEVVKSIYLKNEGTVPAKAIYAHWNNLSGDIALADNIEVTWLSDSTDIGTNNIAAFRNLYDGIQGNKDGKLSLAELVNGVGSASTPAPNQARFYADSDESYTHSVLPYNNGPFEIKLGYKFMETAGNDMQGKTVSFDLTFQAAQHPYGK